MTIIIEGNVNLEHGYDIDIIKLTKITSDVSTPTLRSKTKLKPQNSSTLQMT